MTSSLPIADDYVIGHWTLLNTEEWNERWPNFSAKEMATRDADGSPQMVKIYTPALDALQRIRTKFERPMVVNSAYRDEAHNDRAGSNHRSQHLLGKAFDVHIRDDYEGRHLEALALEEGAGGIGRYPVGRGNFIHMDWRPRKPGGGYARWGQW